MADRSLAGRGVAARLRIGAVLLLGAAVLTAIAWARGAEYDEQYTLFLTAGTARPAWPATPFPAAAVRTIQAGWAGLPAIATDLRRTDVHPPLYFLTIAVWRAVTGTSLEAARLFSVLCGLVSLAMTGAIARRCGIPPVRAMVLLLGCYGFAYTSVIARGFAPALALLLGGVWLLAGTPGRRGLLTAGALFGTACACNYLAVFVAAAAGAMARPAAGASATQGLEGDPGHRFAGGSAAHVLAGAAPFLALDAWFFVAQHGARDGQFPTFSPASALVRLCGYQVASLVGGLPLYADGLLRVAVVALAGGVVAAALVAVAVSGPWRAAHPVRLLLPAALATPIGLLLLGAVFNTTPIELRYLSFGTPFLALLIARACARPGRWTTPLLWTLHAVQAAALVGLAVGAQTMQPARDAAWAAAPVAPGAIALVPHGNDGVGIVGAFAIEAPPSLPLLVVQATDDPAALRLRVLPYRRVILALLGQDQDSRTTLPVMQQAFAAGGWRRIATGSNIEIYEREQAP